MTTARWTPYQRQVLARLVWQAIEGGLRERQGGEPLALEIPDEVWLLRPAATFVTLEHEGSLRGCIGTLEPQGPLGQSVVHNTQSAAFGDPRFAPLSRSELSGLTAGISILTPLRPLEAASWQELRDRLQAGRDGVVVRCSGHSATFLPAVWEDLPEPAQFLDQLWRKAGLVPRFWSGDVRIWTYETDQLEAPRPRGSSPSPLATA